MKLEIEYMENNLLNSKKEIKVLQEKVKKYETKSGVGEINVLKNEIKNLKELKKQIELENNRKEKELNETIFDLKKKIIELEETNKNSQKTKQNKITKNNFFYNVNNNSNGNVILNNNGISSNQNLHSNFNCNSKGNRHNISIGDVKESENEINLLGNNNNQDKFEKIVFFKNNIFLFC